MIAQATAINHLHNLPCGVPPLFPLGGNIGLHKVVDLVGQQRIDHDAFGLPLIHQLYKLTLLTIIDLTTGHDEAILRCTHQSHQFLADLGQVVTIHLIESIT